MMLSKQQIVELLPRNRRASEWYDLLNSILPEYDINTIPRIAAFMAQTAHESADYTCLEENLNYKAQRLCEIWPTRFSRVSAEKVCGNPEMIANIAYANRMGNGDAISGDGYLYRGRGIIQLTGKTNYINMATSMAIPLDELVKSANESEMALRIACHFWKYNGCNAFADKKMITRITKIINGGSIGITERKTKFNTALNILSKGN